ncbi:MAG: class I SAM-dependent methyltransferase [Chlamydiota bacterium]
MQTSSRDWRLKLFNKSILKKDKLAAILDLLPPPGGKTCLDLGGDNGVISLLLRRCGGEWHSADLDEGTVESIRALAGERVFQTDGTSLPFPDRALDTVVIIDFLEHIHDDRALIAELHRVMKDGGTLIVNVPRVKGRSLIRRLRNAMGLTDEKHGHVRPGYTPEGLRALLAGKFAVAQERIYSGFFTELLDACINAALAGETRGAKGLVVTEKDLARNRKKYRLYAALYPFMAAFSRLDLVFPSGGGHKLIVRAVKI